MAQLVDSSYCVYAMIGDPVVQTKTPQLFNAHCIKYGVKSVMVPMHVQNDIGVAVFVEAIRTSPILSGFVTTIPHKSVLSDLVDHQSETARRLGMVNTVRRNSDGSLAGDMLDGKGFVRALQSKLFDPVGADVLILGGGAAGSSIGLALQPLVRDICMFDHNADRRRILEGMFADFPNVRVMHEFPEAAACDLAVNTSPLGMKPNDALPFSKALLSSCGLVADAVTRVNAETDLMGLASSLGIETLDGEEMATGHLEEVLNRAGFAGDHSF